MERPNIWWHRWKPCPFCGHTRLSIGIPFVFDDKSVQFWFCDACRRYGTMEGYPSVPVEVEASKATPRPSGHKAAKAHAAGVPERDHDSGGHA